MNPRAWIVFILAAACSPTPQSPRGESAAASTAGGVVTQVDSGGRFSAVTVSGEPKVGTVDTLFTAAETFTAARTALLDPAGGVWVLDEGARRIARYDDAGARAATIGSVGQGNGQFATPYSMAWGGGDLMVFDPGNSRVGRWHPDGTWVGSWRAVPITGGSNARFFPSGSSASAWLFQFSFLSTGQPAPGFARYPLTPRGDVRWIPPTVEGGLQNVVICTVGTSQRSFATPFTLAEAWQPALGRDLLYMHGTEYVIATVDSAGDTLHTVRRPVAQLPISDAEWSAATAELEAFRVANPGSCNGTFTRPAAKAAVRALTLDDRGRTWVERVTPTGFMWEVWEGDALLGAVPGIERDHAIPIDVRGDRIAVVTRAAAGGHEVKVMRYRLP